MPRRCIASIGLINRRCTRRSLNVPRRARPLRRRARGPGGLNGSRDELREYLTGPPLEIQVHDRDRKPEKPPETPPGCLGRGPDDDKLSSVMFVGRKRAFLRPGRPRRGRRVAGVQLVRRRAPRPRRTDAGADGASR